MPRGVSALQRAPTPPRVGISRPTRLAVLGLVLSVEGLLAYFYVVFRLGAWLPRVRNDAVPNWLFVAAGLFLSFRAGMHLAPGRRLVPGLLIGLNVVVAGAFAAILYVAPVVPPAEGPTIGIAAPDFTLADQHGSTVRLADFRGAPVLLVFYRGHW